MSMHVPAQNPRTINVTAMESPRKRRPWLPYEVDSLKRGLELVPRLD